MECLIPRVVIAATKSGSGKTTIVTGLLAALKQKGVKVQPYKVGPDYIDPGYHRLASGQPSHNLDSWLMSMDTMVEVFANSASKAELAVIEGVMGLYDGGRKGISSTAEIAKSLAAPVVLVLDCKSMGASAAALALGFKLYDKDVKLAGVILNRLGSDNHEKIIRDALEELDSHHHDCHHKCAECEAVNQIEQALLRLVWRDIPGNNKVDRDHHLNQPIQNK